MNAHVVHIDHGAESDDENEQEDTLTAHDINETRSSRPRRDATADTMTNTWSLSLIMPETKAKMGVAVAQAAPEQILDNTQTDAQQQAPSSAARQRADAVEREAAGVQRGLIRLDDDTLVYLAPVKVFMSKMMHGFTLLVELQFKDVFCCCNLFLTYFRRVLPKAYRLPEHRLQTSDYVQDEQVSRDFVEALAETSNALHVNSFIYDFHLRHFARFLLHADVDYPCFDLLKALRAFSRFFPRPPGYARNQLLYKRLEMDVNLDFRIDLTAFPHPAKKVNASPDLFGVKGPQLIYARQLCLMRYMAEHSDEYGCQNFVQRLPYSHDQAMGGIHEGNAASLLAAAGRNSHASAFFFVSQTADSPSSDGKDGGSSFETSHHHGLGAAEGSSPVFGNCVLPELAHTTAPPGVHHTPVPPVSALSFGRLPADIPQPASKTAKPRKPRPARYICVAFLAQNTLVAPLRDLDEVSEEPSPDTKVALHVFLMRVDPSHRFPFDLRHAATDGTEFKGQSTGINGATQRAQQQHWQWWEDMSSILQDECLPAAEQFLR